MAEKLFVCRESEIPEGRALIARVRNHSVGVFRLADGVHALLNLCPHRGAALCEGLVSGTTAPAEGFEFRYARAGEILRCAWHGWEFDIRTGQSLVDPRVKARRFPVSVEGGEVFVHL